jgi:branched-chain amino acid transport system ATP-binding protein
MTLVLQDAVVGYGRAAPVLVGVDLEFAPGEVTTVIGPNGAGKSTLLKAIAGLLPLRTGELSLDGSSITSESVAGRLARGISFCGQGRVNFRHLTVQENMLLAGFSLTRSELKERFRELREADETTDRRWDDRISSLSGGQQQAVEISMALVTCPSVLLLDEPSLGLAPTARAAVFNRIRGIAGSGVTVLVVEQNVKSALGASDRLVVLDQGVVVMDGNPAEVLDDEGLKAVYIGKFVPASATR